MLLGDVIGECDENWEHYLQLLSIMDYVFATSTSSDIAEYIRGMIEDYLQTWKELYPDRSIIPKMHYMVHLPTWMSRLVSYVGNLIQL